MVAHALPVHRCAALLESLTGATPSVGFVHATLTQAAAAMEQADQRIRTLITLAYAVCCDETPIRVGPRTPQPGQGRKKTRKKADKYLLVACTEFYTWYMLGDRDLPTFKAFILADLTGVVVHDRYSLYDHPEVGNLTHQLCCQHILRDLGRRPDLPRPGLADAGPGRPARADPPDQPRPRRRRVHDTRAPVRPADLTVPPRRAGRAQSGPAHPRPPITHQAAGRADTAGSAARPGGRRAALRRRPTGTAHLQPGGTRVRPAKPNRTPPDDSPPRPEPETATGSAE